MLLGLQKAVESRAKAIATTQPLAPDLGLVFEADEIVLSSVRQILICPDPYRYAL